MAFGKTYQLKFKNANFEDKLCTVNIHDTLAPLLSGIPYNIAFTFLGEFSGNFLREFTFDALPVGTLGIRITFYYDMFGVETSQSEEFGPASPVTTTTLAWVYVKRIIFDIKDADGNYSESINLMAAPVALSQIIDIQGAGQPLDIVVVDNDDDKFKAVRGKQATIRFNSTTSVNLSTFAASNSFDQRWYVEADIEGNFIFKGFLILDDSSEPFLSPANVVQLTASDGLARLKEAALTDFDNLNPRGYFTMARFLAMALRKTGLSLPINVVNNIKEESSAPFLTDIVFQNGASFIAPVSAMYKIGRRIRIPNAVNLTNRIDDTIVTTTMLTSGPYTGQMEITFNGITTTTVAETMINARVEDVDAHLYNRIILNSKAFEAAINVSVDSYRALEYLLGESCFVTQEKGEWWVVRVDELARQDTAIVNVYDTNGTWVGISNPIAYSKLVKIDTAIWFSNKQTLVSLSRPHKHVKHNFRYEFPREIICNIDFSRGDVITAPDLNAANSTGDYQIACWTMTALFAAALTSQGFIRRRFEYGYEKERYLVITPASTNGVVNIALAEPVDVKEKDKLTVSVDFRRPQNIGSGEGNVPYHIMYMWLVDDAGQYWHWQNFTGPDTGSWIGPSGVQGNWPLQKFWILDEVDEREWETFSTEVNPFPASGKLYVGLMQQNKWDNFNDNYDTHYQNFQFEYTPYVNGSYRKFSGHYFKQTQAANADKYNPFRDKDVNIGDAPSKNFKGAMLLSDGSNYILAGRFYDATLWPDFVPFTEYKPYGELLVADVFNQYNREFRTFRASLQGLTSDVLDAQGHADLPGNIHRYQFGDVSPHTVNKKFQLLGFDQNIKSCGWSGNYKEVFDSTVAKINTGIEFKYLEN